MYKKLILIFCLLILVGCKKIVDNNNYVDKIYNTFNKSNITNNVSLGYKYYLPKGIKKLKDYDYNQTFLIEDCKVYLYVDVISYYHKKELKEINKDNSYYYNTFSNNNKNGYILIKNEGNEYYLTIVYNYSKIEAYVSHNKLNKVITLSSIILNSIDYNDTAIEKILKGDLGQFSEFTYEVDKPEGASSNFSQYLEEYVQKDDEEIENTEKLPDE